MSNVLIRLASTIEARRARDCKKSYVAKLLDHGAEKCAEKFGEEAIEAIIAAVKNDKKNLTEEAADVIFHLLVMLTSRGVKFEEILAELERREGISGIVEKENRTKREIR